MIDILELPETKITTDHMEIQRWAEKYNGVPKIFEDKQAMADQKGIMIDFPGNRENEYMQSAVTFKIVKWSEFFEEFENQKLAFAYLPKTDIKDKTLAYKLIKRELVLGN